MFRALFRVAAIVVAAQAGNYLGDTPQHGAGTPLGIQAGPINVTVSTFAPAVAVGILSGGSIFYTLLAGYVLSTIFGDRFEQAVLQQLGRGA